jgi:fructose-1,6-bisphosphatase
MSYTSVGRNKVYASIEDLPENQKIVNGDRILIQTDDGTALVDYENIKIDLNHVTFGTQISQLVQFTATVEEFVEQIRNDFDAI